MDIDDTPVIFSRRYLQLLVKLADSSGMSQRRVYDVNTWLNHLKNLMHYKARRAGVKIEELFPEYRELVAMEARIISQWLKVTYPTSFPIPKAYRRIIPMPYFGPGPHPLPAPHECEHDWQPSESRGEDGHCPKCGHSFTWSADTRGKSREWWKQVRLSREEGLQ